MADPALEFDVIYREYQPKIVRYLLRFVGCGEAEDLAQEVFIKAGRALETFGDESRFRAWIYRVATNAAVDRLRSPGLRLQATKGMQAEPTDECSRCAATDGEASVERQAIRKEMGKCVQEIISGLREPYRTVVVLSELAQLRNSEIATMLGLSLDTVKIRLHRARAEMKQKLERGCILYRDERNELACDRKRIGG